jgi:excinuclease ABC subunit C
MIKNDLPQFNLPDCPGVYVFKQGNDILYIGKATSLRDRVKSYFAADVISTRGPLIVDMVGKADVLEHHSTESVLEALLLEANLIKKYQPHYNIKEKDDKSYNYVVITKEDYPRVVVVRGRVLEQMFPHETRKYTFGPFPQGLVLKEAMKIIRKIFPYRDKCIPWEEIPENKRAKARGCFNSHIGLCSGICMGKISKEEYNRMIQNLRLFFEGKKVELMRSLEKEMKSYAKQKQFEKAEEVKRRMYTLTHIQDISLLKRETYEKDVLRQSVGSGVFRIEAYDIAHMSGGNTVGAMTVVENGEANPSLYRKFKIRSYKGAHDIAGVRELIRRRMSHLEWGMPNLIVVDGSEPQRNAAIEILRSLGGTFETVPVVAVVKDATHKARVILGDKQLAEIHKNSILLANSEAHRFAIGYHRRLRRI